MVEYGLLLLVGGLQTVLVAYGLSMVMKYSFAVKPLQHLLLVFSQQNYDFLHNFPVSDIFASTSRIYPFVGHPV